MTEFLAFYFVGWLLGIVFVFGVLLLVLRIRRIHHVDDYPSEFGDGEH